jgi:predicted transcriptional regulator
MSRFIKVDKRKDNQTRNHILNYITENPGAYFSQIRDALDIVNGSLTHHTRVLEQKGTIKSKKDGNHRVYFLKNQKVTITNPLENRLIQEINKYPNITENELVRKIMARNIDIRKTLAELVHQYTLKQKGEGDSARYAIVS